MNKKHFIFAIFVIISIVNARVYAASPLGAADSFAVLGGSTVTSTGNTVLNGNLGVAPGSAVTGFPPGVVNGTRHLGDAFAQQAQDDAFTAYLAIKNAASIQNLSGQDLGGLTLTPGVHTFSSSAQLTGTLILDGQGNANSIFDFQVGSTLTTAGSSAILLINGAQAGNVFWQVGSSATLGNATAFDGTILADESITLTTGATLLGRALALNGAVTLDDNVVTVPILSTGISTVPDIATFWPLGICASLIGWHWLANRRRDGQQIMTVS